MGILENLANKNASAAGFARQFQSDDQIQKQNIINERKSLLYTPASSSANTNTSGFMTMADLEKFFTQTQQGYFINNPVISRRLGFGYDPSPYEQMIINQGRTPYTQTSGGK